MGTASGLPHLSFSARGRTAGTAKVPTLSHLGDWPLGHGASGWQDGRQLPQAFLLHQAMASGDRLGAPAWPEAKAGQCSCANLPQGFRTSATAKPSRSSAIDTPTARQQRVIDAAATSPMVSVERGPLIAASGSQGSGALCSHTLADLPAVTSMPMVSVD